MLHVYISIIIATMIATSNNSSVFSVFSHIQYFPLFLEKGLVCFHETFLVLQKIMCHLSFPLQGYFRLFYVPFLPTLHFKVPLVLRDPKYSSDVLHIYIYIYIYICICIYICFFYAYI